ncbi:hypothetical protein T4C_1899 [Trichinella pseudospiralis]|uniref:Uncharacterized protein n=1 Tax=Trichinella pseudospiralis TaxID=6337 RepID=A0A0V1JGV7_TRIPS|nr:hypothetical protein T4C_1899 [Trichinella pseudospiralis]
MLLSLVTEVGQHWCTLVGVAVLLRQIHNKVHLFGCFGINKTIDNCQEQIKAEYFSCLCFQSTTFHRQGTTLSSPNQLCYSSFLVMLFIQLFNA